MEIVVVKAHPTALQVLQKRPHVRVLTAEQLAAAMARRKAPAVATDQPRALAQFLTMEVPPPFQGPAGIVQIWIEQTPKMRASGNQTITELLDAHERCIESRTDLTECQKNARRRVILDLWFASQTGVES